MASEKVVDIIEVEFKGKTHSLTLKDYAKLEKELLVPIEKYVAIISRSLKTNMKVYEGYLETGQLKKGLLKAVSLAVVINVGNIKMPDASKATNAMTAFGALERAVSMGSLSQISKLMGPAEDAVNAFCADVERFVREIGGSAKTIGTTLSVSTAVGFVVVGAMGTSVLVVAGMPAAAAGAASAAAVAALQGSIREVSRAALGEKMSVWDSVKAVVLDTTIATATAGIGNKLPLSFIDDISKAVAPKIASKLAGGGAMNTKAMTPYISRYLSGTGSETIKAAVTKGIETVGEMAKSGKPPKEKDFLAACEAVLLTALSAGLVKNLNSFHTKWVYDAKSLIEVRLIPDALKSVAGKTDIPKTIQVKIVADVVKATSDKVIETGTTGVLAVAKGGENTSTLVSMASDVAAKDRKVTDAVKKEVEKSLKKYKVK